ncbi:methyltransferase [Nocardia sp. NPDC051030]|uniref:methyltransferase n=1 Tax=Nocardia sp. NPDC051030 TaxID=3155162 RepID=UPI003441DF4F
MAAISDDDEKQPSAWQQMAPVIDLVTPLAVRAVASLRLADLLADGPLAVEELAQRSSTDPEALRRVLRHLVCHGVFTEPSPDTFATNELAALLRSDHPSGLRVGLDLEEFGGRMDLAFTGLLHTLRTGGPAWETVFGAPFWEYLATNSAINASFDAAMAAGDEYAHDAAASYDWSHARHVIDIGGGTGELLIAVLTAHPDLRATLVDLPDTVRRGRQRMAARGLQARTNFAGQSFFDPLPTGGDVYVLSSVIHDWADPEATAILRRCADAAGDNARVVIIEQHSSEAADRTMYAEMNLRMLVLCGGRERTLADYTTLASAAGLTVIDVHTTPLGQIRMECTRSDSA